LSESVREVFEAAAEDGDVVGAGEVAREDGGGREVLEVLGEDFAARAAPFAVLDGVEEALEDDVGAFNDADAATGRRGQGDDVAPQGRAVALEVSEDDVDGLTGILGGAAHGTALLQGNLQSRDSLLDVAKLRELLPGV